LYVELRVNLGKEYPYHGYDGFTKEMPPNVMTPPPEDDEQSNNINCTSVLY